MQIYRPILKQALITAWSRKELWFFGLFAALLNTGSIIDALLIAFGQASAANSIADAWISAVPGLTTVIDYLQTFSLLSEGRRLATATIFLAGGALLFLLSVNGQANLFHHLKQKGRQIQWWHPSPLILGRLLILNVMTRLVLMSFGGITGSILAAAPATNISVSVLLTFATLVLFLPLSLLVGAVSLIAMIEIVLQKKPLTTSIVDAYTIVEHHGVAVLETAILLFLSTLLGTLLLTGLFVVLSIPYLLLLLVALLANSLVLWTSITLFGLVTGLIIVLLFGGLMTSFIYTTWYLVYERFSGKQTVISKLERLLIG